MVKGILEIIEFRVFGFFLFFFLFFFFGFFLRICEVDGNAKTGGGVG